MKNRQEAKLNMYASVISFCYNHTDVIASRPALQSAFDDFKAVVLSMDAVSDNKENAIPAITLNKKQLRKNLAALVGDLALNTFAYAEATGNTELKGRVNISEAKLLRLKSKELPGVCHSIIEAVNDNLPELAAYGITADTIQKVNDAMKAYDAAVARPRNAITEVSFSVRRFRGLIKQADSILQKRMDKIVKTLRTGYAQFYELYFNNRVIVDPHTTPAQIKGIITAKDTGEPLSGVTITISKSEQSITTKGDGKYIFKPLTHGVYSIEASMKGYAPVTITGLNVKRGQITRMDITLVPAA